MANIIGMATAGGWKVSEAVTFPADHTGGYFSECFYVEKGPEKAFLKLLDISRFPDMGQLMQGMSEFAYETELVKLSTAKGLSRVVRLLESGELEVDPSNAIPVLRRIPFLVFERGEGDIRSTVDVSHPVTDKWRFCVLHRAAAGLLQLHKANIAHQDLKPSNVIRITGEELKIGDLGRSTIRGRSAPHDSLSIAGARSYAPFELRYSYELADWLQRRIATDVFHVGCLTVYVFTNVVLPGLVFQKLDQAYHPAEWGDPYMGVVPHIKAALQEALDDLEKDFPEAFQKELCAIVSDMCDPDPNRRGLGSGVRSSVGTTLWLQSFVSRFDILAKRASVLIKQ